MWTFPKDAPYNPNDKSTWPTQYTQSLPQYADIPVKNYAWYVQDDWEPSSHLTVNYGIRWDMQQGAFNESVPALLQAIGDKLGPQFAQYPLPIPFINTAVRGDHNNFGPRVGIAWAPGATAATNIHAGYGLFYDNIRHLQNFGELTWPQAQQIIISNPNFLDPLQGKSRDAFISTAPPNISILANDMVNPYAYQYNVGFTRMLTRNLVASADFTWVQRYSDQDTVDQNLVDPVTGKRPYPQFARVTERTSTSNNTYKALLVKVEKRLSNRFQLLASYTLSKADDSAIRNVLADVYGYARIDSASVADQTPPPGDERHRPVAVRHPVFRDRRLQIEPAVLPDNLARSESRRLHWRSAVRRHVRERMPRPRPGRREHLPCVARAERRFERHVLLVLERRPAALESGHARGVASSRGHWTAVQRAESRKLCDADQQSHVAGLRTGLGDSVVHQRAIPSGRDRGSLSVLNGCRV